MGLLVPCSLSSSGLLSNCFIAQTIAFGIDGLRDPLVRVLFGVIRAGMFGDALHDRGLGLFRDGASYEIADDGRTDEIGVVVAQRRHGQSVVFVDGETQEGFAVSDCCRLSSG